MSRARRLIKAPKPYWSDTALALFLAGETEPRGAHLENLVLLDLLAWRDVQARRPEILYWRTASGLEVDFVVETPGRVVPIEFKAGRRPAPGDAKGLEAFLDDYPDLPDGALLLHAGDETYIPYPPGAGSPLVAGVLNGTAPTALPRRSAVVPAAPRVNRRRNARAPLVSFPASVPFRPPGCPSGPDLLPSS